MMQSTTNREIVMVDIRQFAYRIIKDKDPEKTFANYWSLLSDYAQSKLDESEHRVRLENQDLSLF